jgi:hypothetical protein
MEPPDFGDLVAAIVQPFLGFCYRCGKKPPPNLADAEGWVDRTFATFRFGRVCPDCTTPEERTQAVIQEATTDATLEHGRIVLRPKSYDDDDGEEQHRSA